MCATGRFFFAAIIARCRYERDNRVARCFCGGSRLQRRREHVDLATGIASRARGFGLRNRFCRRRLDRSQRRENRTRAERASSSI